MLYMYNSHINLYGTYIITASFRRSEKGSVWGRGFNVNNLEQIQAIMEAATETNSPVILQASRGARKYTNDKFLYHLIIAGNRNISQYALLLCTKTMELSKRVNQPLILDLPVS